MTVRVGPVDVRRVDSEDRRDLLAVAGLHERLLDFGPLAALGPEFLEVVCYRAPMHDGLLAVTLARVDGAPAGFVAYTADSARFHAEAIRRRWLLAGRHAVAALARRPGRIRAVPRILRVMRARVSDDEDRAQFGEIIGIGVLPEFVSAEFRKHSGRWLSRDLVRDAAGALHREGCDRLRMFVAAENTRTLLLYQFLGASFERVEHGGEPTVAVTFELPLESAG